MTFQICIKTDKSLHQLATEIRDALSLPPFTLSSRVDDPYCQFEMFGMLVLIRGIDDEEREPEISEYRYFFDLHMQFIEYDQDTDVLEYELQPYYAQLLAFHLNMPTAYLEKQKVGQRWQVRYRYYTKNPKWDPSILYGEPGWEPAVKVGPPSSWRSQLPLL